MPDDTPQTFGNPGVRSRARIVVPLEDIEAFINCHGSVVEAHKAIAAARGEGEKAAIGLSSFKEFLRYGKITLRSAKKLAAALGVRLKTDESADQIKKHLQRALRGEFEQPGRRGQFLGTWTGHCLQHPPDKSEPVKIGIELVFKPGSDTSGDEISGSGTFTPVGSPDPTMVDISIVGGFVEPRDDTYISLRYRSLDPAEMLAFGAILLHLKSKSTNVTGVLAGWGPVSEGWVHGPVKLVKNISAAQGH